MSDKLNSYIREIRLLFIDKLIRKGVFRILSDRKREAAFNNLIKERIICDKDRLISFDPTLENDIATIEANDSVTVFNSSFLKQYEKMNVNIHYDNRLKLKYVIHDGKRLYYSGNSTNRSIRENYCYVCAEQDVASPHRYLDINERLDNYIVFDCGCAEANFTHSLIDNIKQAYLFEADASWKDMLDASFASWKNKVHIQFGFLGDGKQETISLRTYIELLEEAGDLDVMNDDIFIKMDIEGAETSVFEDIIPILERANNVKLAICLYHNAEDEVQIKQLIPEGYSYHVREGHMLFLYDSNSAHYPYFRHGVIRIERS